MEPTITKDNRVIYPGPMTFHEAEQVRAMCAAAPRMYALLAELIDTVGFCRCGLEDEVRAALKDAKP